MNRIVVTIILCLMTIPLWAQSPVKIWQDKLTLPSYRVEKPDPNPMFYKGESYQGAKKMVYPYPLIDGLTGIRENADWTALNLENEYLKLVVLPKIGGRLFSVTDKTNGYDMLYRQHVIKPALIGMLGAWISGGIEWCVFHHHRNTTHMPVDSWLSENPDGSKTIWLAETERRHRMRWTIALTLQPGKSYFQADVTMSNRRPLPNSILYWANVAVAANDDYQVIFPPSVQMATYHSKNDFAYWPIGRGPYRGTDYTGIDQSWWKNHPKPVSFFAWNNPEDFMGGYDHGRNAGLVEIGNHNIFSGAKLWEWGPNNIWDTKVLTDSDGPYAELMVGAFSDNQPDYSWIKPGEVKRFRQYWYPVRDIGGFKNATLDAAVNLDIKDGKAALGFHATSVFSKAAVLLTAKGKPVLEKTIDIAPDKPFVETVAVDAAIQPTDLRATLKSAEGKTLVEYQPKNLPDPGPLPAEVKTPPAPKDIKTVEELYLTGLRVEQINNPGVNPLDYYNEALARDPGDTRTNTILGVHALRKLQPDLAEKHLRTASARLSAEYTRPSNTEAYYYLGMALKAQKKLDEAADAFYRATWDYAFHSAAYFQLATLSCRKSDFEAALEQIDLCLSTNAPNTRAQVLKATILRKLNRLPEAIAGAEKVLAADPLDFGAMNERFVCLTALGGRDAADKANVAMSTAMRGEVQSYLELATDYMDCWLWDDANQTLSRISDSTYPMVWYYIGFICHMRNTPSCAKVAWKHAAELPPDYCFPFRGESAAVLQAAIDANPADARAWYYLGNLLYDLQPEKAVEAWEKARSIDDRFALVHRNLGWACFRTGKDIPAAIASYEKAVACNNADPRYYIELDDLYDRTNAAPDKRLAMLLTNPKLAEANKPMLIRQIALRVTAGDYDKAIALLTGNQFFIAEGGGRELSNAWIDAHLLRGRKLLAEKSFDKALADFAAAAVFPENLSQESSRDEDRMTQIDCETALAYAAAGHKENATEIFKRLSEQKFRDDDAEKRIAQAIAFKQLGDASKADAILDDLIAKLTARLGGGDGQADFFAKFGEQQSRAKRKADTHYALALAQMHKGNTSDSKENFKQALTLNASHTWARFYLSRLDNK